MRLDTKRLSLAMASGLALVLAACGGSETSTPAPAPSAEPAAEAPVEAAPEATPEAAPAETPAETPAPTEAAAPADGATGYAAYTGDAAKGKRVFAQCMTCHSVQEGKNNVGPSLYQVVGRHTGSVEGFKYSDANKNKDIVWTEENLFTYLEKPQAFIPGTIMTFPGLRNPQDRADVIAYLKDPS
jgi:cytochrome c